MMDLRRTFLLLMIITGCFVVLLGQLMFIQLWKGRSYSSRAIDLTAAAVNQRTKGIVLDDGRGHFTDRYGKPLTGYSILTLAVEPHMVSLWTRDQNDGQRETVHKLLDVLDMRMEEWESLLNSKSEIVLWEREGRPVSLSDEQTRQTGSFHIPGIKVVPYTYRYQQPFIASHLIGYISQHPERMMQLYADELNEGRMEIARPIGASGLELTFERDLRSRGNVTYSLFTDAFGRKIQGMESRVRDTNGWLFPLQVRTTIDLEMQMRIEQLLDRSGVEKASVVLLDPRTADVLVMVNRPNFDPDRPQPTSATWVNQAIKQQVPGSIFKIVTAAAAIEYGVVKPGEGFMCKGDYGKYGFSCWKKEGHGFLTWREAFAQSCNIAFAEIATRLTPEQIEGTARMLGIGRRVGWEKLLHHGHFRQFDHEDPGQVFATVDKDEGVLIQTAIGQRDVRMTPLQAANMIVSLLNDGRLTMPRTVLDVRYRDGAIKSGFEVRKHKQARISPGTARQLLALLAETVRSGTGSSLRDDPWTLAGKTGTAQLAHNDRVNQWFVGYGPKDRPQFVAAVVVYDVYPGGGHRATRLFSDIAKIVREILETRKD